MAKTLTSELSKQGANPFYIKTRLLLITRWAKIEIFEPNAKLHSYPSLKQRRQLSYNYKYAVQYNNLFKLFSQNPQLL